jgi:hypothetical protein
VKPNFSVADKTEVAEKIIRMLELGYTTNAISKELNLHIGSLSDYKRFYQVVLANPPLPKTYEIEQPEPPMPTLEEQMLGGVEPPSEIEILKIFEE